MKMEFNSLNANKTWTLVPLCGNWRLLGVNGYTTSNVARSLTLLMATRPGPSYLDPEIDGVVNLVYMEMNLELNYDLEALGELETAGHGNM